MVDFEDLKNYFKSQEYKLIIVADGEPYTTTRTKSGHMHQVPAGGVAVALDPVARATNAVYVARAKREEERVGLDRNGKMVVGSTQGDYMLKRLFFTKQELESYYFGFSNQTLWPLCHIAFEEPKIEAGWFEGYKKVNQSFAKAIRDEIDGKTFVWINDYQLALVPEFLGKRQDVVMGMFWHIPWPTWEIFRLLPYKKEILESLLRCDFIAFHRGYQARNFLTTVERELEARIDQEKQLIHYKNHMTSVKSLPLGLDIDVVRGMVHKEPDETFLAQTIRRVLGISEKKSEHPLDQFFEQYKVIFGVDRLDYTKGIKHRLLGLDKFFEQNPQFIEKAVYLGIIAPSREQIPSYKRIKKEVKELASSINKKYETATWKPINLIHTLFKREDVLNFYRKADLCMVTPLDDGMNLVSKEFVVASSLSSKPGMLILSQFAGAATDLASSLIVNTYNTDEVASAIKIGLTMSDDEKKRRIMEMAEMLEERNVYDWGYAFIRETLQSVKESSYNSYSYNGNRL